MDWRDMVGSKLMSPEEAVQVVEPGAQVMVAPINCTPFTLCQALYDRRHELTGVAHRPPRPALPLDPAG